jgi:TPR repeat protein
MRALLRAALVIWPLAAPFPVSADPSTHRAVADTIRAEAFAQLSLRAEGGDARAQYALATMFEHGRGVTKNLQQAFDWYHRSALQGHRDAQLTVGRMYSVGRGVEENFILSMQWLSAAASQGSEDARYEVMGPEGLGWFSLEDMNRPEVREAVRAVEKNQKRIRSRALPWYRAAAEEGLPRAQVKMGMIIGDLILAHMLYTRAKATFSSYGWTSAALDAENRAYFLEWQVLSHGQLEQAKALAENWRPGTPLPVRRRIGRPH